MRITAQYIIWNVIANLVQAVQIVSTLVIIRKTKWLDVEYNPDSKAHGANMGPICGRQNPGGPHVGPKNFAIWVNNVRSVSDEAKCKTRNVDGVVLRN